MQRPIIFVCHSLGGIVVKRVRRIGSFRSQRLTVLQALAYSASRTSKSIQHVHSIYVSTFGILFLGTPHDGSSKAQLASISRRMIGALVPSKVVDTQGQLLDALQEGSEVLQNITDMFVPLMKNFHIFFFWEQEKTNMGVTQDYVHQSSSLHRDFRC
jgi:hypothetical protein